MIRQVTLAVIGALAPMLIMGAIGSMIILMTAPLALIYALAFVALTPISSLVLWRVLPSIRRPEAPGEFINKVTEAGRWIFTSKSDRESSDEGTSLPAPMHLGINVVGRGRQRLPKVTLG